jgi:signal transduction histidine kinase
MLWRRMSTLWQSSESTDYQAWRHRFLYSRLQLCLWIAVPCFLTIATLNFYELFISPEKFNDDVIRFFGNPDLPDRVRRLTVITNSVIGVLLASCLYFQRTRWGQRYPAALFLCFSWSVTLAPQIIGTHLRLPDSGIIVWYLVFLAQATLMPVHWRLHLLSQLGAFAYYAGVNPLLGLTTIEGKSIYSATLFIFLFWFCFICDLAVYLYERLQRAEFESRRELRVFLHAVSHDLKTPVLGTSIVLQNLLKKTAGEQITVHKSVLERLLQGSNRQIALINSLLEAHEAEVQKLVLHRQPIQLCSLVNAVLADLEPALSKNQIIVHDQISSDLPWVEVDATQLWRVYSNLITNAIKHNPHGIEVTLRAEVVQSNPIWSSTRKLHKPKPPEETSDSQLTNLPTVATKSQGWIRCSVQDNGIGIPLAQQERLFELYARGTRARYMPGLGLGLYLCRQIIVAHGGETGVNSQPKAGATFWFTLPLASPSPIEA